MINSKIRNRLPFTPVPKGTCITHIPKDVLPYYIGHTFIGRFTGDKYILKDVIDTYLKMLDTNINSMFTDSLSAFSGILYNPSNA